MNGNDAELRRRDAEARRIARNEFERPVVLEAGAGTGKTATLVARILVWALGPGWDRARDERPDALQDATAARVLDRICAITFTERAAVEMKERVAKEIERIVRGEEVTGLPDEELPPAPRRGDRARALLVEIDRLHVETIHAFCRRILAEHAIAAGLHPGFEVDADGDLLEAELDTLLAEFLIEAYGEAADPDALDLLERGIGPGRITEALRLFVSSDCPATRIDRDPYPAEEVLPRIEELARSLGDLMRLAAAPIRDGKGSRAKALEMLAAIAAALPTIEGARDAEALMEAIEGLDLKGSAQRLDDWAKGSLTKTEANLLGDDAPAATALAGAARDALTAVTSWNPAVLRPAFRLLGRLAAQLKTRLHRRGAVTFADLLRGARDLLEDRPEICALIRGGIDQLLVDEVQDTDPIQYEIVRRLALEGDTRPGLFLVGDPKQSIYAFRNADLAAFEDFLGEIRAAGGSIEPLTVNFRSDPPILAEVERLVAPVMSERRGLQPAFERLLAAEKNLDGRGFEAADRRPVEYWNCWRRDPAAEKTGPDTSADEARRIEAECIAADMVELHANEGVDYKDMAILLRATTQQETYLQALRNAGIPYLVEKDKQFYRRREIIDAVSLLVTILDPLDQVALIGFLRSPTVGLPDAALLPLWRHGFPKLMAALGCSGGEPIESLDLAIERAAAELPPGLPELETIPDWPALLGYALRALADLRVAVRTEPADVFLDRLRRAFGLESQEAARFLGGHRLANLDRFFREVLRRFRDPGRGVHEIRRELVTGITEEKDEAEGSPGDQTTDAVRVMSVHKAKGLDFRQVYFAALHQGRSGGRRSTDDAVLGRGDDFELRLFGATTPGFRALEIRNDEVGRAEAVRILYVAVTRAAKRFVLGAGWPKDEAEVKSAEEAKCSLDLLRNRTGALPAWEDLDAAAPREEVCHDDDDGIRWRLPDHPGREAARARRSTSDQDPSGALDGLDALEAARAAKREREERPALATASTRLEEAIRDDEEDLDLEPPRILTRVAPDRAARFGTALHRILECWPETTGLGSYLEEAALGTEDWLRPEDREELAPALATSLRRLASSDLARRLEAAGGTGRILARELPLAFREGDTITTGTIDLLYEGEDGALVVADYKTDRIEDEIADRIADYAGQGRVYRDAVAAAFAGEEKQVRFELWFLDADLVKRVEFD